MQITVKFEDVFQELENGIDTQFDPEVVAAFMKIYKPGELDKLYAAYSASAEV